MPPALEGGGGVGGSGGTDLTVRMLQDFFFFLGGEKKVGKFTSLTACAVIQAYSTFMQPALGQGKRRSAATYK